MASIVLCSRNGVVRPVALFPGFDAGELSDLLGAVFGLGAPVVGFLCEVSCLFRSGVGRA